jgi:hypothetical protein
MVALADWYFITITPPIGETFRRPVSRESDERLIRLADPVEYAELPIVEVQGWTTGFEYGRVDRKTR